MSIFSAVADAFRAVAPHVVAGARNVAGHLGNFLSPGEPFETSFRVPVGPPAHTGPYRVTQDLPNDPDALRITLPRVVPTTNDGAIKFYADQGRKVYALGLNSAYSTSGPEKGEPSATVKSPDGLTAMDWGRDVLVSDRLLNPAYHELLLDRALGGGDAEKGAKNRPAFLASSIKYREQVGLNVPLVMEQGPLEARVFAEDHFGGGSVVLDEKASAIFAPLTPGSFATPLTILDMRASLGRVPEELLNAMGYTKTMSGNDLRMVSEWILYHELFGHEYTSGATKDLTSRQAKSIFDSRLSGALGGFTGADGDSVPYPLQRGRLSEFGPIASAVQEQYMKDLNGNGRLGSPEATLRYLKTFDTPELNSAEKIWAREDLLPEFKRVLVYRLDKKSYQLRGTNTIKTGRELLDTGISFLTPAMLAEVPASAPPNFMVPSFEPTYMG